MAGPPGSVGPAGPAGPAGPSAGIFATQVNGIQHPVVSMIATEDTNPPNTLGAGAGLTRIVTMEYDNGTTTRYPVHRNMDGTGVQNVLLYLGSSCSGTPYSAAGPGVYVQHVNSSGWLQIYRTGFVAAGGSYPGSKKASGTGVCQVIGLALTTTMYALTPVAAVNPNIGPLTVP